MAELDLNHLEWAIDSRSKNQKLCLRLLKLVRTRSELKESGVAARSTIQSLISVAFSLWRAAFLSDKEERGLDHAETFLEKLVTDNTIGYAQDRNSRNWTWPYYITNAQFQLNDLKGRKWPDLPIAPLDPKRPQEMWDSLQQALEHAVDRFEAELDKV